MVDRDTAIELRKRSNRYGTKGIPKNVDRNDERGEFLVGRFEFCCEFGNCRCEHRRGQGAAYISISYSMEETSRATCVKKVMDEMTATLAHFNFSDQFTGFLGSSGPSQSTMSGSTSLCIVSGSFLSDSSLRWPASKSISFSKLELAGDPFPFGAWTVDGGTFSGSAL